MSNGAQTTPWSSWTLLRAGGNEPAGIGIPTRVSDTVTANGAVRFALGQGGEARLLLPLGPADRAGSLAGAPSLDVRVSDYTEAGQPKRFLDLTCLNSDLEAVFADVAGEIIARIEAGQRCVDAAKSTIEEFRALLLRPGTGDVAYTRIAGLVGELLVLKRLLDRSPGAWSSWRGPAGARHDFTRAASALEVKVSIGRGRSTITVNGLDQLTEPAGGTLFLQHFELEIAASAMLSVASLGSAVLAVASHPDEVRQLLAAMDCFDVNDPKWNAVSFRLEGEAVYEVVDGFPRLVPSVFPGGTAPAGISAVTYAVELGEAAAFRLDASRLGEVEEYFLP